MMTHDNLIIAGVDEAGRGPLAGSVVAAAVILPQGFDLTLLGDSKALNEKARIRAYDALCEQADVAIASTSAETIDNINIRQATLDAMRRALLALNNVPNHALIDGRDVPEGLPFTAEAVIKGDQTVPAISAASIIAKVTRDRMMVVADHFFPEFCFKKHKGYGVAQHRDKIETLGICPFHRKTFSPVKKAVAKKHT